MSSPLPRLYTISDRHRLSCDNDLLRVIEELLKGGARMVQLREKDLPAAELFPLAQALRTLTADYQALLLINDRIDVALAVAADGVHLGHHSLPTTSARRLLGPDRLLGVSTHHANEIRIAAQEGADFVTYGPVFPTPSKAHLGNPVGLDNLRRAAASTPIPVYALGGIEPSNMIATLQSGAYGVAAISCLLSHPQPQQAARTALALIEEATL